MHELSHILLNCSCDSEKNAFQSFLGQIIMITLHVNFQIVFPLSVVTWRHGSGMSLVIVRKGGGNFSDHQVAACAMATVHKPPGRAHSSSAQKAEVTKRSKKDSDSLKRCAALGHRRSKSLNNLNIVGIETNPFPSGQLRRHNNPSITASCSALDLPLPPKPHRMSTLYEDGENPRQSEFLGVMQNVAYTTHSDIDSRPPCPPPYSKSPQQSHLYEQLDLAASSSF